MIHRNQYRQCRETPVQHAAEKDKRDEMIGYAKSLGVPDNQCDFLPEDFRNRDYGV